MSPKCWNVCTLGSDPKSHRPISGIGQCIFKVKQHGSPRRFWRKLLSVLLGDPTIVPIGSFIPLRLLPIRKCHFLHGNFLPWHHAKQVSDAIQSSALFVVGLNAIPGRLLGVGSRKHCITCSRVVVPATMRFKVHRAQFPPPHWILDPPEKPLVLFLFPNLKPVLGKNDAIVLHQRLKTWTHTQEIGVLLVRAKAHYMLD